MAGDILVFKAGDGWVDKSIAWLTGSEVSHAAMVWDDAHMVEMGLSGISMSEIAWADGENACVLRLNGEPDPAPLLRAAQVYMDAETRYDLPALVILAGMLVYKNIRPTGKMVAVSSLILKGACAALDKMIQSLVIKRPGKAMVSSQLVYQIYRDAGKPYEIQLENGLLQAAGLGTIRLLDMTPDAVAPQAEPGLLGAGQDEPDVEELARQLAQALEEQDGGQMPAAAPLGSLPGWAKRFLERLEEFLEKTGSALPVDALFVTPADLAAHGANLEHMGCVSVERLQKPQ